MKTKFKNDYVCLFSCKVSVILSIFRQNGNVWTNLQYNFQIRNFTHTNCQTRVDVWTDWHEHRSLFDSLYVFAQKVKGKSKGKNGGGPERKKERKQGLTLKTTVFSLTSETGGREDHCPAQFTNYNGEGTWVGIINILLLRHTVQTESPWGGSQRPCLYKPAARDTGPL
jgi:hypothetical protein